MLPLFGKIFERILFNSILKYIQENDLPCEHQSGFQPNDSCVYQLLSIVHNIYASSDVSPPFNVSGIYLDMSKESDKVWHEGLLYKMKCFGINDMLLKLLQNFLENRLQRVLLNGRTSSWGPVLAGVPQRSILGPLVFLIYINDISKDLRSVKRFANDTSIFSTVSDIKHSTDRAKSDLDLISR